MPPKGSGSAAKKARKSTGGKSPGGKSPGKSPGGSSSAAAASASPRANPQAQDEDDIEHAAEEFSSATYYHVRRLRQDPTGQTASSKHAKTALAGSGIVDFWQRPKAEFPDIKSAQKALNCPLLFYSYFTQAEETLSLIENNSPTSDFDTRLAHKMVNNCTVTIYVYGETGSGKSTLIRNLTLDGGAESSSTFIGTKKEGHHAFASGLRFIDTPGFRIPLPMSFDGWGLSSEWVKEYLAWSKMIQRLKERLDSGHHIDRPLGIVYCHKAGTRVIPDRVVELLSIPHKSLVPVFLCITDCCSVADEDLEEIHDALRNVVNKVGFNARGKSIHLIEVNSESKNVRGHGFEQSGLDDLSSLIVNSIEPMDVLTFCKRTWLSFFLGGRHGRSSPVKRKLGD